MSGRTSSPSSVDAVEEPAPVEVKKESPEDEIKEYAETAMNELLGWYGYEKLDRRDTEDLDLHHFASRRQIAGRGRSLRPHPPPNRPTRHTPRTKLPAPTPLPPPVDPPPPPSPPKVKREASESPTETTPPGPSAALEESSADASSSSPHSPASLPPTTTEALLCSWCGRAASSLPITAPSTTTTLSVRNGGSSSVTSTTTKAFCSEICFTQCRRASFKRSKACDWCRHVRHTVAYVDFQDGETQLQFCSDKCLNQYKMNIFCKETQAHLAQLKAEASASTPSTTTGPSLIITPDLWLRDCREGGEEGGREEDDEEEEEEEPEETEGDPETSPRRQQRRTLSTDVPGSKPPEKKSKEHRRKKRRLSEEVTPSIPPPVIASGTGPFQQVRHPAFVRVPRKTPTLPQRTPPGFVPPLPIPSAPPFLPPHFPPHVPLPILPPEAHFSRFLRPRAETLPTHVIPNGPTSLQPPPPRIPPAPQPPSLLPPVTMLVPYPIILPIPVPIPIPIPILGDALLKKISKEDGEETEGRPPATSPRSSPSLPQFSPSSQEVSTHRDRAAQRKRPRGSSPEDDSPVVGSKRKFVPA